MLPSPITYESPAVHLLDTFNLFLSRVIREKFEAPTDLDWRATKLKEFIDDHLAGERWSLDDVCKEIGLPTSVRQTRRLFKTSTGMSVRKYAKNKRLVFAAEQLQATDAPVKAIALDVGYNRTAEFTRSFKELFRLSPVEFRRIWRRSESAA